MTAVGLFYGCLSPAVSYDSSSFYDSSFPSLVSIYMPFLASEGEFELVRYLV